MEFQRLGEYPGDASAEMGLISPGGENLLDFLHLGITSTSTAVEARGLDAAEIARERESGRMRGKQTISNGSFCSLVT